MAPNSLGPLDAIDLSVILKWQNGGWSVIGRDFLQPFPASLTTNIRSPRRRPCHSTTFSISPNAQSFLIVANRHDAAQVVPAGRSLRHGDKARFDSSDDAGTSASLRRAAATDRDTAAYTLAKAARYLRLPSATLRSWVLGREYPTAEGGDESSALIRPASKRPALLSFPNLIEAHVLRSLRTEHGVPVKALRDALANAQKTLGIDRLLLRPELRATAGKVFLDRYGELIDLSASGQLAMRQLFNEHLKRIEWDKSNSPIRLYPFLSVVSTSGERPIVINPHIAFGRPVVERRGVSTSAIVKRIDAGESVEDVANDYDLGQAEIEQAILYERAA